MSSPMDLGTFVYEAGVLLAAALAIAALTWILTFWRWKPHLSIEQSASWRRMSDGKLCITVEIRYRNPSTYRAIRVQKMVVELQRLATLSPDEAQKAKDNGREDLPNIDKKCLYWDKKDSRLLEPGEMESEVCMFPLSNEVHNLTAFVVYTFIFGEASCCAKFREVFCCAKQEIRGWGVATCHDIIDSQKGGAMIDEPASKPDEKVTGTESRPYEPSQPPAKSAADNGGQEKDGSSSPPSPPTDEE